MQTIGVITGDIISSTAIPLKHKSDLICTIKETAKAIGKLTDIKIEFFRGDSFQVLVYDATQSAYIAILLRSSIQLHTPDSASQKWDARIAIGIGSVSYDSGELITSDGEAFHNSGWEFDQLGKRNLAIRTPWPDVNDELFVSTAFADDIITNWSITQAKAVYYALLINTTQREIATKLNTTHQNVSKILSAAKEQLVRNYLTRFNILVQEKY